jgi:hypothetical protein
VAHSTAPVPEATCSRLGTSLDFRGPVSPAANTATSERIVQTSIDHQSQPGTSRPVGSKKCEQNPPRKDLIKDEYSYDFDRFTHNYYEYEQGQKHIIEQGQKHIIVKGRLREHVEFWRSIGSSDFILDNRSALLHSDFVNEAIRDLLDRCLIERCTFMPYIITPLTVSVERSGKKRLILDLRIVNQHLWKQSVKFEDLKVVLSYLRKGVHLIKFDLSAYHFIDIYQPHTDFLGFAWPDDNGILNYYTFLVLPFGLSSACYIFTKLTRPLVKKWRSEGKLVFHVLR